MDLYTNFTGLALAFLLLGAVAAVVSVGVIASARRHQPPRAPGPARVDAHATTARFALTC